MKLTEKEIGKLVKICECEMNAANGRPKAAEETGTWLCMHNGSKSDGGLLTSLQKKGAISIWVCEEDCKDSTINVSEEGFAEYLKAKELDKKEVKLIGEIDFEPAEEVKAPEIKMTKKIRKTKTINELCAEADALIAEADEILKKPVILEREGF